MGNNPLIEAREKLLSAVETLPPGYLNDNAAPLLKIIRELKRSYQLEFQLIQDIMDLDVSDQRAVAQFATNFRRYHKSRDFDNERTHCRNIDRNVQDLLVPLQGGTDADRARVKELQGLLMKLRMHDVAFLDEIELTMDRVLEAVNDIDAHGQASLKDPTQRAVASQKQEDFIKEFDPKFAQLKGVLKRMNEMIEDLIDRL